MKLPVRIDLRKANGVSPTWASAGIVDARAFSVGESTKIHTPRFVLPNRVTAACGLTAQVVESDRATAYWRDGETDCATCKARA